MPQHTNRDEILFENLFVCLFVHYFLTLNYLDWCSNLGYKLESPRELFIF